MNKDVRSAIYKILNERFNSAELRDLAFDLDINYDNLKGHKKLDAARELITYAERHGRIQELIDVISRYRPQVVEEFSTINFPNFSYTPDELEQLNRFYDRVNLVQQQLQDIQEITSLSPEDAQDLQNLLEDAPHELLENLLSKSNDPDLKFYAQQFAELEHKFGIALVSQGNWYAGLNRLKRSLTIRRVLPDLTARADTIYQIGRTYHLMGNLAEAQIRYRDALRLYEYTRNEGGQANCNLNLGNIDIQLGFLDKGLAKIEGAKTYYLKTGNTKKVREADEILQFVSHARVREMA